MLRAAPRFGVRVLDLSRARGQIQNCLVRVVHGGREWVSLIISSHRWLDSLQP